MNAEDPPAPKVGWHEARPRARQVTREIAAGLVAGILVLLSPLPTSAQIRSGHAVYERYCYYCHGIRGDARTEASRYLSPGPRDFTAPRSRSLSLERLISAVRDGRPGTAMQSFSAALQDEEIRRVAVYVRDAFIDSTVDAPAYHTAANGWPDHERYADAFPFVTGSITLDTPEFQLTETQRTGRHLFVSACLTCHEPRHESSPPLSWTLRPVTEPPDHYLRAEAALETHDERYDPHHRHETPPALAGLSEAAEHGRALYLEHCAHCHAANGSGRNWRGSFLEPPPPAFDARWLGGRSLERIRTHIRDGRAGTSMPAWRGVLADDDISAIARYLVLAARQASADSHGPGEPSAKELRGRDVHVTEPTPVAEGRTGQPHDVGELEWNRVHRHDQSTASPRNGRGSWQ